MLFKYKKLLLSLLLLTNVWQVADALSDVSLNLQNANLASTIRLLGNFLHINVIVSDQVQGFTSLNLQMVSPKDAFDTLLITHHLAKLKLGNIWFVAPQEELIKQQQEELKKQALSDDAATLVIRTWEIRYAKATDIARLIQDDHGSLLSKRGSLRVDERSNTICVQDINANIENVNGLIKRLDVAVQQIAIEARLASVDSDFERQLGIDFAVKSAGTNENVNESIFKSQAGYYSLAVATLADGSLLDVKLSALENAGHANLISSPSLFTSNQQPASIEAGEEVPYQEVSDSGGTAVVFKKAVVGLKVTPQVLPGNKVLLQLQINQDRPSNKMVLGMPTISTRQMMTNVLIKNGQTIVLGGIYETNVEDTQQGLPFLSSIPILGSLFKQQRKHESKRELLIFVTPKIIA